MRKKKDADAMNWLSRKTERQKRWKEIEAEYSTRRFHFALWFGSTVLAVTSMYVQWYFSPDIGLGMMLLNALICFVAWTIVHLLLEFFMPLTAEKAVLIATLMLCIGFLVVFVITSVGT